MSTAKYPEYLYRYTSVDYMFDTVRNNKLYLTNPEKWRDQNDAKQLEAYRERLKAPAVWVLCLSETRDSLFHWNAIDTE
ncbi:MAG: hypothetical protein LBT01_02190, partial [Spirochaetaceae bacterium]|nr:hypothetical protein [Spirochaetaceae bacterium]